MIENIKAHAWPEAYKPPELSESEKVLTKTAYVILSSKFLYLQTVNYFCEGVKQLRVKLIREVFELRL